MIELNARSSDRSIYMPFFFLSRRSADLYVDTVLRAAGPDHQALVARLGDQIVGVASYERTAADEAEVALLIDDAHQHLGIGMLLLEHPAAAGRAAGLRRFVAETLTANVRMLHLFDRFGFAVHRQTEDDTVHVTCSLLPDEAAIAAVDEGERIADVASLAAIFAPRSIVVVGVSRHARDPPARGTSRLTSLSTSGHGPRDLARMPTGTSLAVVGVWSRFGDTARNGSGG